MRKRLQHKQEQEPAQEQEPEQKQEHDPSKMAVEINIHQIIRILSEFIGRGGGPPRLRLGGNYTSRFYCLPELLLGVSLCPSSYLGSRSVVHTKDAAAS